MIRKTCLIVFVVALASGWAGAAWAVDGGKADPTGDVFNHDTQKSGPGDLDIVKVNHHDNGKTVVYEVRTARGWATAEFDRAWVNIDDLEGVPQYDCQQVAAYVVQKNGTFEGHVAQCLGSGGGQEGGPGGTKNLGPVSATHVQNSDTITVAFDLSTLRNAGFKGNSYRYNIYMKQKIETENSDLVPNNDEGGNPQWITHTFDAAATAAPSVATPMPTVQPTLVPTPEVTLEPSVEPTPVASTTEGASFSAPEERTDDSDGTSTPLRVVAAGSVIAGAGIALVRFWPA